MTRRIKQTDARIIGFLTKMIQKLEQQYPQLQRHSKYRILFERKTNAMYSLSFWCEAKDTEQKRRVEIPLIRVTEDQWFDWRETRLTDVSEQHFLTKLHPVVTFNLTFAVVNEGGQSKIALKRIAPGNFHDYGFTSELNYETRTASA